MRTRENGRSDSASTVGLRQRAKTISVLLALALPAAAHLACGQTAADTSQTPPAQTGAGTTGATAGSTNSTTTGATSSGTAQPLKGGVQKVQLSLERLRDIGLDLKRVMTAAKHLYDEVSIQPVTLITEPEVVGRGIVINIPIGTRPAGPPQPPRKERVDMSMNDMIPVITTFKKNADDFVAGNRELDLPEDVLNTLQPMIKDWIKEVTDIANDLSGLEPLTAGPTYDNAAIASACVQIQKDVKELDEIRRKVYKVIRKEGNRTASAGSTH